MGTSFFDAWVAEERGAGRVPSLERYQREDVADSGRIVFEHIGCKANPWYVKNHPNGA